AVDQLNNPGIGLTYPYDQTPQRGPVTDRFWRERTAEYVQRLKEKGLFDARVAELKPVWERMARDRQAEANEAETNLKEAEKAVTDLTAREKKEKDKGKLAGLKQELKDAESRVTLWAGEVERRKALAKGSTVD